MRELSLEKAAAFSFALHIGAFIFLSIFASHQPDITQKIYTISIVTPEAPKTQAASSAPRAQEAPKADKPAATIATRQRAVPQKKKASPPPPKAVKPAAKIEKPATDYQAPSERALEYKANAIDELRRERQSSQSKSHAVEEIEAMKAQREEEERLERITSKAAKTAQSGSFESMSSAEKSKIQSEYEGRIHAAIYNNWSNTEVDNLGLSTVVELTIHVDGTLMVNRIEEPSGNRNFDQSVLKAIKKTEKVEPPPFGRTLVFGLRFYPE